MDDGDFEEFNEFDGDDYKAEIKAFERVGPSGKLEELLSGKKTREGKDATAEDRFLTTVDALSRGLNDDEHEVLTQKDINNMLEQSQKMIYLRFKNPAGYVLGYIASNAGTKITEKSIKKAEKLIPKLGKNYGIELPDIIRYARHWKLYLS